jgi:multidrug transporter EmrE-like cation transporter
VKSYLLILPTALLVTFGQLVVKWRTHSPEYLVATNFSQHLAKFVSDPIILCAYAAGFIANFAWLYIVTKLPLTIAFPVYMGLTFAMVLLGGWMFLAETLSVAKIFAVLLIMSGIVLAVSTDA